jgi:hypothetical protein
MFIFKSTEKELIMAISLVRKVAKNLPFVKQHDDDPVTTSAKDFLGVSVGFLPAKSKNGKRVAVVLGSDGVKRSIAIHKTDSQILVYTYKVPSDIPGKEEERKAPGLLKCFTHTNEATILVRALPTNYAFFSDHIRNVLLPEANDEYGDFLVRAERFANPRKINDEVKNIDRQVGRDLWIWADHRQMVPASPGEETAGVNGIEVGFDAWGNVARSCLYRKPVTFDPVQRDLETKVVNHYSYAAPLNPTLEKNRISYAGRSFAFWLGEITPENIQPLLKKNLDIMFWIRSTENKFLYVTTVIRSEAPNTEAGKVELNDVTSLLNEHYGKWERLVGDELWKAFHAFIPGAAHVPDSWRFTGLNRHTSMDILGAIPPTLTPISDPNGIEIVGKVGSETFLVDPRQKPGQMITGESKLARKSGTTAFRALALIPPLWVPLSKTTGDTNEYWGENYCLGKSIDWNILVKQNVPHELVDGESFLMNRGNESPKKRVIELALFDALDIIEARSQKSRKTLQTSKEEVYELQEELHERDRKHAKGVAELIFKTWYEYGYPVGRPLTFKILSGQTTRLMNWYDWFLKEYIEQHDKWYAKTNYHDLLVFDNWSTLFGPYNRGEDTYLSYLPKNVALNLGTRIYWLLNHGANIGILTWIIAHTEKDMDWINPSAYFNTSLHMKMGYNNGEIAHILSPRDGEVITDSVVVNLPPHFSDVYQRREIDIDPVGLKPVGNLEAPVGNERFSQ